jgi:FKBP-type peptidyl-prolyl cis-trans isomerase
VRKTTAVFAAFALLVGLTACSGSNTVAGCSPTIGSGDASRVIKAPGKIGTAPKVTLPTPLYAKTTQKSTVITGHGAAITAGQPVVIDITILNGRTGAELQKTAYSSGGGSLITAGKSDFPAVSRALECAQIGSRIVVAASAKDGHSGKADATNGIRANDSFIYVIDVERAFLAKANGDRQSIDDSLPAVVTTANGTPGITFPTTTPPSSFVEKVLKKGTGAKVESNHYIVVQYTGASWTGKHAVFDSTWKVGQASVLQPGAATVSAGLTRGLVGQRVGSQVLLSLPASIAAASDGSGTAPAGETVLYVVDILGIAQ